MKTTLQPSAAWMRAWASLRTRWRSWFVLVLLLAVAGGFVASVAAGARRTDSVYERLLNTSAAFDIAIGARCLDDPENRACVARLPAKIDALPSVADTARVTTFLLPVTTAAGRSLQPGGDSCFTGSGEVDVVGSADNRFGTELNRRLFVDGHAARRANDVVLSEATARRMNIEVGDGLRIFPVNACDGPPRSKWPAPIPVRVVGIQRSAGEIPPEGGFFFQSVGVTPAIRQRLLEKLHKEDAFSAVRLRSGATRADFKSDAKAAGIAIGLFVSQVDIQGEIEHGLRTDVTTMWLLAILGGAVAMVVLGQALTRQVWLGSDDLAVLRAMGYTRRDLATAGAFEGAVVGAAAAILGTVIAVAVSAAWPIGKARRIEPDPGISFDPIVVVGAVAVVAFATLVVGIATRRAAAARREPVPTRASRVNMWTRVARLPVTATCGARMLRRPSRGTLVLPLRSAIGGIAVGLVALIGAITFAAGLDHLVGTPRLVGWNWDLAAFDFEPPDPDADPDPQFDTALRKVAHTAGVERVGFGTLYPPSHVQPLRDGPKNVVLLSFGSDAGAIGPTVIEGRAPAGPREILLAPGLLDDLDREIGDTLVVHGATRIEGADRRLTSARVEIVGTGVLPVGDGRLGVAASLTFDGLQQLSAHARPQMLVVDVSAGADVARVRHRLANLGFSDLLATDDIDPKMLVNLDVRQASSVPRVLAVLMALLAAGVLVHLVATNVRARRLEFATLRAVGFTGRQRRATVVWLGTVTAFLSLLVAVPLGVVGGRIAWRAYATNLGVLPEPATPWLAIALVVAATFLLSAVVAAVVARGVTGAVMVERGRGE